MKIWESIKTFFVGMFAKPLLEQGGDLLEQALEKMATKNPKLFKTLVVSAHTAAKEYGADLVASTATDLDDKALAEFLEALEHVAEKHGIDLDFEAEEAVKD